MPSSRAGGGEVPGDGGVLGAWVGVAGGVVVGDDEAWDGLDDGGTEHLGCSDDGG